MKRRVHPKSNDQGAALATVLVMVAVMSGLAIVVVDAARFSLQRTSNQAQMDQTRLYLMGAEAYAASRIDQMINSPETSPGLLSQLVDKPITLPLDDGAMQINVRDGGNCFNLNSVVIRAEDGPMMVSDSGRLRLARLAALLNRPGGLQLAQGLAGWITGDASRAAANTAPPNRLLADVAELRGIEGFSSETVAGMAPFVCSRPVALPTTLNINTLRRDQAVLLAATFGAGLTLAAAERIITERPAAGWKSIDEFLSDPRLISIEISDETRAQFAVAPRWFLVGIRVRHHDASETSIVLMDAGAGHPHIVRRVFGADPERALL